MTKARCIALIVSFSIAVIAFGPTPEARAEPRQPLSSAQIRQVMSRHAPAIRECYVQHSMKQQGAKGSLTLELLVRASGRVAAVAVKAPGTDNEKVEQCVSKLARGWRFPASDAQTLVMYPMMFLHTQNQGAGAATPERGRDDQAGVKKQRAARSRPRVVAARKPGGRS